MIYDYVPLRLRVSTVHLDFFDDILVPPNLMFPGSYLYVLQCFCFMAGLLPKGNTNLHITVMAKSNAGSGTTMV